MALALQFDDADARIIEDYAAKNKIGVFDFVRRTLIGKIEEDNAKDARNAAYLAKIDRSIRQFEERKYVAKSWEELEQLVHE